MWTPKDRAIVSSSAFQRFIYWEDDTNFDAVYATAPFMGPGTIFHLMFVVSISRHGLSVLGPIVSGWIAETRLGWRFNFWLMIIFSAVSLVFGFFATPETVSYFSLIRSMSSEA